ncbi:guanylate kinase [Mycoplasmoides gallisepticum CA06_2006.052-5-2P]|uniref:Guanylate kinase n=2 Tax=Mycoplasmoides gallisepticum TaxID=2096 RepID=A0AB36DRL4_MYCGL|nr:guanylate kinase [Mycoplasmoides gallisepticum]AFP76203.1 guanylate kinase [Mycoplasmoides gallisepticum VA94_7994-1-7P]AFP76970.1 guanylate kinase [Mycoplasmoides gallisepticum NC95_13295-2-2P]AFP77728.1 guanylate kinase [Mycoplasmoides gallisepticum NC96_1596-4-2P]AFP78495.1 guanylate kinase [Mycoplasmoides gallisepticum NY01_2001.047-5-1P]AFP79255.1 guanylate kinase [Mycoplasmoides gallisepticum WI01_2001.043-13-2P]
MVVIYIMSNKQGLIILISGPSGVGKGTIVSRLLSDNNLKLNVSISATTRKKRASEVEGVHYFFKTKEEFEQMIANNQLLEYANYVNNYYGTPLSLVKEILDKNENLILEIEYQGVIQVLRKGFRTLSIFVLPPSEDELVARLKKRGTENDEVIKHRLEQAVKEYAHRELYDHTIINDDLEKTIEDIKQLIRKYSQ